MPICNPPISRRSFLKASAALAGSDDPLLWSRVRVATKYPTIAKRHFAARGVTSAYQLFLFDFRYAPIGGIIGLVLFIEMIAVAGAVASKGAAGKNAAPVTPTEALSNTQQIGSVLYTDYVYFFQAAGLVLLVAMVGAIVLTLRHRVPVKRQDMAAQVRRTKAEAMEVVKVRPGQGLT